MILNSFLLVRTGRGDSVAGWWVIYSSLKIANSLGKEKVSEGGVVKITALRKKNIK